VEWRVELGRSTMINEVERSGAGSERVGQSVSDKNCIES
jgi:hypothetical protein